MNTNTTNQKQAFVTLTCVVGGAAKAVHDDTVVCSCVGCTAYRARLAQTGDVTDRDFKAINGDSNGFGNSGSYQ